MLKILNRDFSYIPDTMQVIVQTCKRLEVYSGDGEFSESTALHLFRLVCGLESVFIGDTAVKAQVKNAYLESAKKGYLSKGMHKLFQWALYVGKLVRSTTDISVGAVSYPQAVINMLKILDPDLCNLTVTLVGINDITGKLMKWLIRQRCFEVKYGQQNADKVENIAENFGASAFQLEPADPDYGQIRCIDFMYFRTGLPFKEK